MKRLWLVLATALAVTAGSTVVPVGLPVSVAENTLPTNPLGFAYASTANVSQYGRPTGMVVTGRCNRYAPEFAAARANGAEIMAYLDAAERPDTEVCPQDTAFYGGDLATTPLWPTPTYGERVHYPNMHMTDIRAGSTWSNPSWIATRTAAPETCYEIP